MARAPRLSLSRRQLRVGIGAINLAIAVRSEGLDALASSDAEAEAEYMALRDRLTPWQRRYHPVARRKSRARWDLALAHRDILELTILRDKLQAALDKETT